MGMGFKFKMEMGMKSLGNWYEKSVPAHLYLEAREGLYVRRHALR